MADRPADCCHFRGTGGDKEAADFILVHAVRTGIFPLGNHSRHFHRLTHIHNMIQQVRETDLNQSYNRGTCGRNHRPGQVRILQPFADCPGHHVRSPCYFKRVVKAHLLEAVQYLADALEVLELPVQTRRRQSNFIFEFADGGKRIRHRHLSVIAANPNAFAAVNTTLVNDVCPPAADPDRLRRTPLQAVGTSSALVAFQPHRMKPFFHILLLTQEQSSL